jgi:hypothetical protein
VISLLLDILEEVRTLSRTRPEETTAFCFERMEEMEDFDRTEEALSQEGHRRAAVIFIMKIVIRNRLN